MGDNQRKDAILFLSHLGEITLIYNENIKKIEPKCLLINNYYY